MVTHKSLYYSVLACAASHIFLTDSVWEMHPIALSYYAEGVKELQLLLGKVSQYENHDALLMSVMLLYLHGVCPPAIMIQSQTLTAKVPRMGHA